MKPIYIKSKAQQKHYRKPIRPIKYRNLKDIEDNEKSKDSKPVDRIKKKSNMFSRL